MDAITPRTQNPEMMKSLRIMTKSAYSLQKLRIQMGLRLCSNFRDKLKIEAVVPDEEEAGNMEELGEKAQKIIAELKERYKRLTDGIAKNRTLPKREGFKGDGVISDFAELVIIHQYFEIEKQEKQQFRLLGQTLEEVPIWNTWLKNQVGVGDAMGAVLLSWFKVDIAVRPSQFHAYAGMDVAQIDGLARSRRKNHLVEREYVARDGKIKKKMSTTYDPWLQSRLLGVLGGSFLRTGSPYRKYYDDYKHRISTDPARRKGTLKDKKDDIEAGEIHENIWHPYRIHRASIRYMVKQFVADFWRAWRIQEGLPVVGTYAEDKLGHVHGGFPKDPT